MNRRVKSAFGILCAAVLGTVVGRLLRESYIQPNEDGSRTSTSNLSIPDLIPGLVAAGRTRDVPWVWLRIPMPEIYRLWQLASRLFSWECSYA